jgi:hypothetical protein
MKIPSTTLIATGLVWLLASPALGAAPAAKPPAKGKAAPAAAAPKAAPAPGGEGGDADLASAGKVIELTPDGAAKTVKGEATDPGATDGVAPKAELKLKPGEISVPDSCKLRLAAQCKVVKRCQKDPALTESIDTTCQALVTGCEMMSGKAAYSRKEAEACAKGLEALKCDGALTLADYSLEAKVPACKPIVKAEQGAVPAVETQPGAGKGPATPTDSGDELPAGFKEIQVGGSDSP